ncbi:MAG: pirin family protein [Thermaerobacter sp.]|nr:pirin family protein [Thermaerobacter sp.]
MAIERSVGRVFRVQHKAPGGPHVRQGFVLEPDRWAEFDPFLLMAEDWFQRGTFGDHPHRGMETVTLVLEGRLEHRDNHGGAGVLGPGDVQWMTAGGGVVHAEEPLPGETVHSLQLWVNLPRAEKMTPPAYQDLQREKLPVRREEGAKIAVISGSSGGVRGLARSRVPVTAIDASLEAGTAVEQDLPANYNGFLYVVSTVARFAGQTQTSVVRAAPVPTCAGCSRNPLARVPTISTHESWSTNHWESPRASRGKPPAHSHGTSTSPTTGSLATSFKALDRRGIRNSDVGPATADHAAVGTVSGFAVAPPFRARLGSAALRSAAVG